MTRLTPRLAARSALPFTSHPRLRQALAASALVLSGIAITHASTAGAADRSTSPVQTPGEETSLKSRVLALGAGMWQTHAPINALNAYYLDGFHFHAHEVKSGQLIAPGIPQAVEKSLMTSLASTYGKTWHTWHTHHGDQLPMGIPRLMMGFTADGQANEQMVSERDRRFGIHSKERRREREDIDAPTVAPGADAWQKGQSVQLERDGAKHDGAKHDRTADRKR